MSNQSECLAGTSPLDPASRLAVTSIINPSNDVWVISWSAVSGKTYRVQFKTNITDAVWEALPGDVSATNNAATKEADHGGGMLRRIWRILLVP